MTDEITMLRDKEKQLLDRAQEAVSRGRLGEAIHCWKDIAALNPDYRDRDFDAIEGDLQRGWNDDLRARHGEWTAARPFARDAYTRSRAAAAGSTAANAVKEAGHKTANAIDDIKDRVDGNPASRPGVDPTDRPERSA